MSKRKCDETRGRVGLWRCDRRPTSKHGHVSERRGSADRQEDRPPGTCWSGRSAVEADWPSLEPCPPGTELSDAETKAPKSSPETASARRDRKNRKPVAEIPAQTARSGLTGKGIEPVTPTMSTQRADRNYSKIPGQLPPRACANVHDRPPLLIPVFETGSYLTAHTTIQSPQTARFRHDVK